MKLNPSSHPAKAGFHREAISPNAVGFIPSQRTDLVEKSTKFDRILSLFLDLPDRIQNRIVRTVCELTNHKSDQSNLEGKCGGLLARFSPHRINQIKKLRKGAFLFGLPDRIRTCDLKSRSLARYPAVPRVDIVGCFAIIAQFSEKVNRFFGNL